MERKEKYLQSIVAALGLLVLILDSNLALEGAGSGIELCIKTVIPSLFPFFVLSMLLMNSLDADNSRVLIRLVKYFKIPAAGASVLLPAVLGGYPVGAKCAGDLYRRKQISKKDAEYLLSFCNNAGPSFLFGMVSGFFPERKLAWLLWLIHLLSAGMTAIVIPSNLMDQPETEINFKTEKSGIILSAAKAMCMVCCWVVLFRIVITFLKSWVLWMLPVWVQVWLIGFLELANGCCELMLITDIRLRFILCSCMLAFGGICVLLQTASVTEGLSLKNYWKGKIRQTGFSLLLSWLFITGNHVYLLGFLLTFVIIFGKIQNRYRNPKRIPV